MKAEVAELAVAVALPLSATVAVIVHDFAPENWTFIGATGAVLCSVAFYFWKRKKSGDSSIIGPLFGAAATFFTGAFGPKASMDICYGLDQKMFGWAVNTSAVTRDIWAMLGLVYGIVLGVIVEILFWLMAKIAELAESLISRAKEKIEKKGRRRLDDMFPDSPVPAERPVKTSLQLSDIPPSNDSRSGPGTASSA